MILDIINTILRTGGGTVHSRHEQYPFLSNDLPFVFYANLERSYFYRSSENNWHDNLEIQFCVKGSGTVLLDGRKIPFSPGDIAVVNSNVMHYTGTNTEITYSCLILSSAFCEQNGIRPTGLCFESHIQSPVLIGLFHRLTAVYVDPDTPFRLAKLNQIVLEILIELAEHHTMEQSGRGMESRKQKNVKAVISYLRENYHRRITLEEIGAAVLHDKYALCREFKELTGQTIMENLNNYRCIKAIEFLDEGHSVTETASLCGFENLSFFSKTFRRYIGKLPSEYKNRPHF